MCSPIQYLPSYKEPLPCMPCIPVAGPRCLPCGIDNVTLRRPLIVGDSTFEYRPTSWPGMLLNNQDKKIRYQLINYERPKKGKMCDRMNVINQLQSIMSSIRCSPCGPMVCYKYEDCGPPKGKASSGPSRAEEGGAEKKDEKENQLKRTKSRELRGGIMYYSCHCIKRNGLQHDCRRTGCGGEPACLVLPDPLCAPSQLARARGLADPAPLAAHMQAASGGGRSSGPAAGGSGSGKRFIVCELKGVVPDVGAANANKGGKCCKCPASVAPPAHSKPPVASGACFLASASTAPKPLVSSPESMCPCKSSAGAQAYSSTQSTVFALDEKTMEEIFNRFETKELAESSDKMVIGPGGRPRKPSKPVVKEPCTRPGCVHWQPPPPCVWDLPCKADCFETPAGIQPGRNPLTSGGGGGGSSGGGGARQGPRERMKLLTPHCCTGCSAPGGGATAGGPSSGLPLMVMKLC